MMSIKLIILMTIIVLIILEKKSLFYQKSISADDICKLNIEEVGKSKNKTQKRKLHRIAEDDIKENTNCVRPAEVVSCVQKSSRNAVTSVRLDLGKLSDKQKPFDGEGSKNSSSSSLDVNNYIGEHHKKGSTKTLAGTKLRHKKQKKKMKLIDQYLDDFSDSSTGDKDDTAIEEASLGLKETSALLKDAVTVDKSCQRNDKEKGRDGILASNTGKITKDKFKFRRLELKRTTVPLSDESSFFKSREVPSVDRKVVPQKRQKNSSCMSPGYPETVSVSSQSFHNKVRSSGVESSSNVNMTAGYVFKHQPDTVPLNEDLQPSASSSDLHHSEIISNSMVRNRRHDDYKSGIKQRVQLSWQIPLGLFTDSQVDMILHQLQLMFCKKNTKHLDYVLKVIFPEVLIKIYMDVFHVDHTRAESNMNDAVYQSDSQLELSLTDSTFSV
ncbi:hypothetical protein LSH36_207g01018 [Paralvinella palmiformis]|uniref:Uncharacterized protein n=1 Tax=Paralvinella palmiformis TaxID=53620 RepID=A0AAD9JP58_9ANNE|nr:hypothetical protein LSH36_207g01018 [Paralvinella palmiformis]